MIEFKTTVQRLLAVIGTCALAFLFLPWPTLSLAGGAAIPIEFSEPPPMGSAVGPYRFTPTAIVVHNSASWARPDDGLTDARMVEGYRNYHMTVIHPGLFPDHIGVEIAQQNFPDGLSAPDGFNYNDIDYHALIGADGSYYPGRNEETIGWHAGGSLPGMPSINTYALGLCGIGNFSERSPSDAQLQGMVRQLGAWCLEYNIVTARIYKHSEIRGTTSCPGAYLPWSSLIDGVRMDIGEFTDLLRTSWAWPWVRSITQTGGAVGFIDQTWRGNNPITREQFALILYRLKTSGGGDLAEGRTWAKTNGYLQDDRWTDPITRAEAAQVVFRVLGYAGRTLSTPPWSDLLPGAWEYTCCAALFQNGILAGSDDGLLHPSASLTRNEAAALISRALVGVG